MAAHPTTTVPRPSDHGTSLRLPPVTADLPRPSVSVVMNVYNGERDVEEALHSIAAQTHTDFEVVVWDDGSTDRTVEVVTAFVATDPRFRLIVSGRNEGLVAGRRQVIEQTTGDWIALCDADDVWLPTKLERQLDTIVQHEAGRGVRDPQLVVVGTNGHHINTDGQVRGVFDAGVHDETAWQQMRDAGAVFHVLNSSALFRRDAYDRVGGYRQDYYPGEDVDLWTRLAVHGQVLNLEEVLVSYRVHGESISDKGLVRQMINTRRVGENARRRRDGLPEISHEDYLAELRSDPVAFRRLLQGWTAQSLYRSAGSALANGRWGRGAWLMLRSFAMDPAVPVTRLRRQVLRPELLDLLRPGRQVS